MLICYLLRLLLKLQTSCQGVSQVKALSAVTELQETCRIWKRQPSQQTLTWSLPHWNLCMWQLLQSCFCLKPSPGTSRIFKGLDLLLLVSWDLFCLAFQTCSPLGFWTLSYFVTVYFSQIMCFLDSFIFFLLCVHFICLNIPSLPALLVLPSYVLSFLVSDEFFLLKRNIISLAT